MSPEEARQVTASFSGSPLVPPPRTIEDIGAILDKQKHANPEAVARARTTADQHPPDTADPTALAEFYYRRGLAARDIGRAKQQIADLTEAARWAAQFGTNELDILFWLAEAEFTSGNLSRSIQYFKQAIRKVPDNRRGWLIPLNAYLASVSAVLGDLETADAAVREARQVLSESIRWTNDPSRLVALRSSQMAMAEGYVQFAKGQLAEAERFFRQAFAARANDPSLSKEPWLAIQRLRVALVLLRQGRLLEAETEARTALLETLGHFGRNSPYTGLMLQTLTRIILEQGRSADAESLGRAMIDIYERTGVPSDSRSLAGARDALGAALLAQGRSQEALAEYEAIRTAMAMDPPGLQKLLLGGLAGGNLNWALALIDTGNFGQARDILHAALQWNTRQFGERHALTAQVRGLLAMTHAAQGERAQALKEFARAVPILLSRVLEVIDEEATSRPMQDQRVGLILASYIGVLADVKGTPLEREVGFDVTAEAFRLTDVARGRSVQRALDAGAARAAVKTPALADLVRREQNAQKQIGAMYSVLANALSQPTDQQNVEAIGSLRRQIDTLERARRALAEQIKREFPAYAELIQPAPTTLEQARASMKPGEALIATYVAPTRTFVWAIPRSGPVAFAAVPMGEKAFDVAIDKLRRALDPSAKTLGEIPDFDVAVAHDLYRTLLEPVKAGWQQAESLLIVADGPLGRLPFSLLVTRPAPLGDERGMLFSRYRDVPWLVRRYAVTGLPSVGALVTLRRLPPADPARHPFVGFGDPYFTMEQARQAAAESPPDVLAQLLPRGGITLRNLRVEKVNSTRLAMLPRLPDTAAEIRSIASAMRADLSRDVFLGVQANEHRVKTLDLSRYQAIAFATHGLVPGDLDGLTQPALALTAPEVANVEGDGLLTMEEILTLRLNADWVILSACNTAAGRGAGSEAVSGLGRAFFYAGARALLVSNWPVETTSARALMTELFRRQAADPRLPRAQALQQTMNALINEGHVVDDATKRAVFSYAHPIFWAPFTLVGDGGAGS